MYFCEPFFFPTLYSPTQRAYTALITLGYIGLTKITYPNCIFTGLWFSHVNWNLLTFSFCTSVEKYNMIYKINDMKYTGIFQEKKFIPLKMRVSNKTHSQLPIKIYHNPLEISIHLHTYFREFRNKFEYFFKFNWVSFLSWIISFKGKSYFFIKFIQIF